MSHELAFDVRPPVAASLFVALTAAPVFAQTVEDRLKRATP